MTFSRIRATALESLAAAAVAYYWAGEDHHEYKTEAMRRKRYDSGTLADLSARIIDTKIALHEAIMLFAAVDACAAAPDVTAALRDSRSYIAAALITATPLGAEGRPAGLPTHALLACIDEALARAA